MSWSLLSVVDNSNILSALIFGILSKILKNRFLVSLIVYMTVYLIVSLIRRKVKGSVFECGTFISRRDFQRLPPMSTDVLGVVTPVISNLAFAIGLFVGNNTECEKSIWERKESVK